ncbi:MAG: hypothetical protein QOE46_2294 [Acidobacteriota bacterium]|nr:hypothetical protein [Acidobacteriota bacterium]
MRGLAFVVVAATLMLAASALAHAQGSAPTPAQRSSTGDTMQDAMRDKDSVRREERVIGITSRELTKMEREADASHHAPARMFKAEVVVTNHGTRTIKSVSWSASLTDPGTDQLIRTYDVTTAARIAPGKTKKLTKQLPTPRANVVSAAVPSGAKPHAADLKAVVTRVTYTDGSTSTTP